MLSFLVGLLKLKAVACVESQILRPFPLGEQPGRTDVD